MTLTVPLRPLWLRWNAILCAVSIFVWSTPEEDRLVFAAGLGVWLALSLFANWAIGRCGGRTLHGRWMFAILGAAGAGLGAAANLLTVLLMVFKDVRHAHAFPDFPPALLGAVLERLPSWAAAGLFFGLGLAFMAAARNRRLPDAASSPTPPVL